MIFPSVDLPDFSTEAAAAICVSPSCVRFSNPHGQSHPSMHKDSVTRTRTSRYAVLDIDEKQGTTVCFAPGGAIYEFPPHRLSTHRRFFCFRSATRVRGQARRGVLLAPSGAGLRRSRFAPRRLKLEHTKEQSISILRLPAPAVSRSSTTRPYPTAPSVSVSATTFASAPRSWYTFPHPAIPE